MAATKVPLTRLRACSAWMAIGFSVVSCQRSLAGAPCPCADGWVCCTATNVCQLTSDECRNSNEAGDEPLGNCGSTTTLYEFDEGQQEFAVTGTEPEQLAANVTWDAEMGYFKAGSLLVEVPFNDVNQKVPVVKGLYPYLDLTGQVVVARVYVDQDPAIGTGPHSATGGTPDHPSVMSLFARTGMGRHFAKGPSANLVPGGWIPLIIDLANPNYADTGDAGSIDPTDVRDLGLLVATPDLGTFGNAILNVDSFTLRQGLEPSAPPWTFDCGSEGFAIGYISNATMAPTVRWSSVEGNPSPGSLELTAAFSGPSQELGLSRFVPDGGIDLRGKTLSANVRLVSGLSTQAGRLGTAQFNISAGSQYVCGDGPAIPLVPGSDWARLTLSVDNPLYKCDETPGAYDPSTVRSIGIVIKTANVGTFAPATLLIDSITVSP